MRGRGRVVADTPHVPVVASPPTQAMSLSAALRQAAIDVPKDLPPGVHLAASVTAQEARVVVTVQARNAYGVVAWEHRYDGTGRRLSAGVGITF
jgi:hypothetical protein